MSYPEATKMGGIAGESAISTDSFPNSHADLKANPSTNKVKLKQPSDISPPTPLSPASISGGAGAVPLPTAPPAFDSESGFPLNAEAEQQVAQNWRSAVINPGNLHVICQCNTVSPPFSQH
jgi:hypothetical protein